MCFFKKKIKQDAESDKVNMQAAYARAVQVAAMAEEGVVKERIEALAEELKYFAPTSNAEAVKIDQRIYNMVDDLRAVVAARKTDEKTLAEIKEIETLVSYRKALLETSI